MRDYAELVKALRTCEMSIPCTECPFYSNGGEPSKECATMNVAAADAIEELLAAVPKWYSVSDPPKENGRYYVAYEDSVSFLDYFNGKWFFPPRNGIVTEETKESIINWMPLPKAPKEVE